MDIALAVERILYAAQYLGSVTANSQEAWDAVIWDDERRAKPTWEELETAWRAVQISSIVAEYEAKIQARLDDFARTLTYDGILSACTYATSAVDTYRIEGQYCVDMRDATWHKAYELFNEMIPQVEAGAAIPPWSEIESRLPDLIWPEGSRGALTPK